MSTTEAEVRDSVRFELPVASRDARDTAVRLATACFTFESDRGAEYQPDEVAEAVIKSEAARIARIVDAANRQEAVTDCMRSYVRLAGDAQKLAIAFLQLTTGVDKLSEQLHDAKESAKYHRRPR